MAKAELGTKRLCANCGAKFYDLSKDPITCPKCGTVFQVAAIATRGRPDAAAAARAAAPVAEVETPEATDAEFVSLEEADAEAQGKKAPVDPAADADEDIEIDESLDDAAFIPEEEEDNEDVTDIIRDVDNEEET
ncbi:MAG: TIGR02300 family protein [Rhizobiales bacterium]|nr:TIGR02300 family protein [Hyphomicrobiales bacterium]